MAYRVFITGSSRGLGRALTELYLQRPDHLVVGLSRSPAPAELLRYSNYRHASADLSEVATLRDLALGSRFFVESFGAVKAAERIILVNNAGLLNTQYMGHYSKSAESHPKTSTPHGAAELDKLITCNVTAPMMLSDAFVRIFQDVPAKKKVICNISSGASLGRYDGWAPYCASKAALSHFSKVLQKEQDTLRQSHSKKGSTAAAGASSFTPIQVLCVMPGVIDTEMVHPLVTTTPAEQFSRLPELLRLRAHGAFRPAARVAAKALALLDHPEDYAKEVVHQLPE